MFSKAEKILTFLEEYIILISIVSSLIVVFINIVLRYLFAKGFVFSEEYARYTMVLIVYLGVSQAVKKNSMIRVDILSHFFPALQLPMDVIANLFSLLAAVILICFGLQFTVWQFNTGQNSIAMEIPLWIAYAIVPIGGLLMGLRYTVNTIGIIKGFRGK